MDILDARRWQQGPLLYAHRGGRYPDCPENTLKAFQRALSHGVDVIETDAHLSVDAHVVLAHDPDGRRVAGVDREIRRCPLVELRRWDLGGNATMPTLDEALEALPEALFNIDIKQRAPDMTEPLVATIARHAASSRVLLTSFHADVLDRARARYDGPTGLSQRDAALAFFAPRTLLRAWPLRGVRLQIPPRHGPLHLGGAAFIAKMHTLGIAVDYWVIDDPETAETLLSRGADGIVTDEPAALAQLFARAPQTASWRRRHAHG